MCVCEHVKPFMSRLWLRGFYLMTFRLESRNRLRVDAATGMRAFSGPKRSPAPRKGRGGYGLAREDAG